jgi:predicted metal-binding membrane protein
MRLLAVRPLIIKYASSVEWLGFFGLILLAWLALYRMQSGMGMGYATVFSMWVLMTAAMMAPSFVPSLATFRDLTHTEAATRRSSAALLAGYMLAWIGFSALAALAQLAFLRFGWLGMDGASNDWRLTAVLLLAAGAYQFSPLKSACLSECRAPLTYFMGQWRPGVAGAARMGWQLGVTCLGCCWALMALGFVGGVMNLLWMGIATALMVLEKLPRIGDVITKPLGVVLLASGVFAVAKAFGV